MKGIRVDDSKYIFTHGKKPSGFGMWWFKIKDETMALTATFQSALLFAKERAEQIKAYSIEVLP